MPRWRRARLARPSKKHTFPSFPYNLWPVPCQSRYHSHILTPHLILGPRPSPTPSGRRKKRRFENASRNRFDWRRTGSALGNNSSLQNAIVLTRTSRPSTLISRLWKPSWRPCRLDFHPSLASKRSSDLPLLASFPQILCVLSSFFFFSFYKYR